MGELNWRKSSFSGEQGDCVEVADLPNGGRLVRDTKGTGATQSYTESEWQAFVKGVKAGEFD